MPLQPVLRYSSTDEQHLDFGTFKIPPANLHIQIPVLAENELYVSHVWAWAAQEVFQNHSRQKGNNTADLVYRNKVLK